MKRSTLDLAIGLVGAVVFHGALAAFGAIIHEEHIVELPDRIVTKAVHKEIVLPKPPPPPEPDKEEPKPEPPKPEPKAEPKPVAKKPKKKKKQKKKRGQPKRKKPAKKQETVPADEPAPLVLSKTYGAGAGGGVEVQAGDDDMFGDPAVEANERNTRPRA